MNDPHDDLDELDPELRAIVRAAAGLPRLSPSRDLWSGIESRIGARVIALPTSGAHQPATLPWRRLAIAASLLVAVTAGVTYSIVKQNGAAQVASRNDSAVVTAPVVTAPVVTAPVAGAPVGGAPVEAVSLQATEQTFDREIGAMRSIVDERRKELDPATVQVLEKNLKVIDAAISESKAALEKDPASAFLMDRLTHAYDTKLHLLRSVASIPAHG